MKKYIVEDMSDVAVVGSKRDAIRLAKDLVMTRSEHAVVHFTDDEAETQSIVYGIWRKRYKTGLDHVFESTDPKAILKMAKSKHWPLHIAFRLV